MKRSLPILLTALLLAIVGIASAQSTQWFGYAIGSFGGDPWSNRFISFDTQHPNSVQTVSETLAQVNAAAYVEGDVWFVTATRSLCKAPFNEETQTLGTIETVVPLLDPYRLIIDMAYNPLDGKLYYLCQDSQYNSSLKCSSLDTPSDVQSIGDFNVKFWTLAINAQGQAYGVAYEEGNLCQIHLADATTTLVGPTGKSVWYNQSMAFDLDSGELYWAQLSTATDHAFCKVDLQTGAATTLGDIGSGGAQLTGLFMIPQTPEPTAITEISLSGFTAPVWGEHPDDDIEVDPSSPYTITEVVWHYYNNEVDQVLEPEGYFNLEEVHYYLDVLLSPKPGFVFDEHPTVYFDGDGSVFDYGQLTHQDYRIYTVAFDVTDPTGLSEQSDGSLSVWPNPAQAIMHIEGAAGKNVVVYDAMGRRVLQQHYANGLDVSALAPGLYTVSVAGQTSKILVK